MAHATCFSPARDRRTPSTLDRDSDGGGARPVKRCRIIEALDERILLRLDSAHAAAVELVQDVVSGFELASVSDRLVWHALAIYRRALIDLEIAAAAGAPLDVVFLAASLLLAQRMVTNTTSELARLGALTTEFSCASGQKLSAKTIAACTWRIALSRGYDFACARSCPFDVAADVLLAPSGGSGDIAQRYILPLHSFLDACVADRLREAGDHLLSIASSSRGLASEDHATLGVAAAVCAIRAKDGPLTPAAFQGVLERLGLLEHRAAVLAAAVQMRAERLVRTMLHKLPADLRKRICLMAAHSSSRGFSQSQLAGTFVSAC